MSILDQFFKQENESLLPSWTALTSADQLDQIMEDSHQKPVFIFKHSVRCGISAMAKYNLEREWDFEDEQFDFYYLDIFQNRPISNQIAHQLDVIHQSPQLILIRNGHSVFDTSHHLVHAQSIKSALGQ